MTVLVLVDTIIMLRYVVLWCCVDSVCETVF